MILELVAEVARFMLATSPKPRTAKELRAVALTALTAPESASRWRRVHFGERSAVLPVLDQLAACILAGKGFADVHPEVAKGLPADTLAAYEAAVAPVGG